jgi:hypothetical protein
MRENLPTEDFATAIGGPSMEVNDNYSLSRHSRQEIVTWSKTKGDD